MLRRLRTATLPFVLALSLIGIPQITVAQSVQDLFQQGNAAQETRKYTEAEQIFRQIIQLDPDNADAYRKLGNALYFQRKLDEAIANYRKAIELDPNHAKAYNNLGNVLGDQGKLNEALTAYRKAIELDPNDAKVYYNLGNALAEQGELDEAIANFRKAIELAPDKALVYNNLGSTLAEQGELDEAIANFRKAIELDPNFASAYNNLGVTLKEQGRVEEAITEYKRAIAIDPKYATAQNNLKEAERLLAIKLNPPLPNIGDRQYLPSEKDEPLVPVLRSIVRIIVVGSPEQNPYPGAGWVIKREKNTVWIVTNRHVIGDDRTKKLLTEIQVEFFSNLPEKDRPRYPETLIQMTDPNDNLDLAILKITDIPDDIKPLKMRPGLVRRLASVIVIGHPYTRDNPWDAVEGKITSFGDILPIDANVATGNSGGPVIDEQTREVIGIVFGIRDASDPARPEEIKILAGMRGTEGVGVAYPIDVVIKKLQEWQILPK